ncbi:hypothetical protein Hanom_Chr03g00195131 [Helianthus anomalus]
MMKLNIPCDLLSLVITNLGSLGRTPFCSCEDVDQTHLFVCVLVFFFFSFN